MAWGSWRSCWAWWWGRGGDTGSSEEGDQADLAEKEDDLGWRKMVEKDGLGLRRDGHGEDGLGVATQRTW
jgi:hypothetical protein